MRSLLFLGLLSSAAAAETVEDRIRQAEEAVQQVEQRRELADKLARLETRIERLLVEETALQDELKGVRDQVESVRARKHAELIAARRKEAVGSSLPELETDGGVYREVTILEVSDIGLRIRHASGLARIGFEELSEELGEKYGYDPEVAKQRVEAENEQQELLAAAMGAEEETKDTAGRASKATAGGGAAANRTSGPVARPTGRLGCRMRKEGGERSVEITAVTNCPARITVRPTKTERGSRVFSVPGGKPFTRVIRLRRTGPCLVYLRTASGELLASASP